MVLNTMNKHTKEALHAVVRFPSLIARFVQLPTEALLHALAGNGLGLESIYVHTRDSNRAL